MSPAHIGINMGIFSLIIPGLPGLPLHFQPYMSQQPQRSETYILKTKIQVEPFQIGNSSAGHLESSPLQASSIPLRKKIEVDDEGNLHSPLKYATR